MDLPLEQYRILVESAPTMIWRAGLDAKCDYFNETWLAFTGRTMAQELGDGWIEGVHPEDLQCCVTHYLTHFERREAFQMEYRLRRHDGAYRWIIDRGAPFFGYDGAFEGFVGHCADVHERRTADEAKTTFLAMFAHEIRTPLQALVLYATAARRSAERGVAMTAATTQKLERQVNRLRRLVTHTASGFEAMLPGGTMIEIDDAVELARIVESAIEVRRDTARGHVAFELRVEGEPRKIRVDAERIAQALDILLDNAVKFSPDGGTVETVLRFDADSVSLEVLDEGDGIAEADRPRLGTPFFRGTHVSPRRQPGIGLGLAIAKSIASAHGGQLELARREPRGTVARFSIGSSSQVTTPELGSHEVGGGTA